MPKLIRMKKNGVTIVKPERAVDNYRSRGYEIEGEVDPKTGKLMKSEPKKNTKKPEGSEGKDSEKKE